MEILKYVQSLLNCDFESFSNFIDSDCDVSYSFNGQPNICKGDKFVSLLKKGHFENTIKSELLKLSIQKEQVTPNYYKYTIDDDIMYDRLGLGREEDGPGKYRMQSFGIIDVLDNKIIKITYSFEKEKI